VVIPAFNEAASIREVATRTLAQLPDVIVVDDGSADGTSAALAGLPLTLIRNPDNRGKAACIWLGAQAALAAGAEAVVTIDGDGQHSPEDLPRLLEAAAARPGAIVVGSRLHAKAEIPKARYRANRFANFWIAWAAGQPIADTQSGFRLYPAAVFRRLAVPHGRWSSFVFESEVLIEASQAGMEIVCVPVSVSYANLSRASHFRPVADIAKIVVMVAARLLRRGLNLPGLLRSLRAPEARGNATGGP
jgi:glycosyltransferase involved in cell wall biosynthesis